MAKLFHFSILLSSALTASCSTTSSNSRLTHSPCTELSSIPDSRLLIFGELHGTNEAPALVAEHVCVLSAEGREIVVGLEVPSDEQPQLDNYLGGSGEPSDKLDLLAGHFWQRPSQDGRSSAAILRLIDRIRAIKVSGGNVRIVAIDKPSSEISRDAAMARAIRTELQTSVNARVVVLMGNYHASKAPSSDPTFKSTAFLLSDLSPTTVLIGYRAGTAWACMDGTCGIHPLSSKWAADRFAGFHSGVSPLPGYDGTYLLETITASPPARASQ